MKPTSFSPRFLFPRHADRSAFFCFGLCCCFLVDEQIITRFILFVNKIFKKIKYFSC
nr:MAG TPA: hypothetical protein [Caudoviricetes sp.]